MGEDLHRMMLRNIGVFADGSLEVASIDTEAVGNCVIHTVKFVQWNLPKTETDEGNVVPLRRTKPSTSID